MSKLLPIILVIVVLIGQGVIAFLFVPSAAEVAAVANGEAPAEGEEAAPAEEHGDAHGDTHADAHGGGEEAAHGDAHGGGHGEEAGDEHAAEPHETTEVDLGGFKITVFQPAANTTLFVDFHLSGTVKTAQAGEFKHLLEANQFKFRDQVNVIIRSSGMEDFTDAGLGLLKNQILEKTNRALGKPLLISVAFPEFSFIEQ